jgi:hypothetical protein
MIKKKARLWAYEQDTKDSLTVVTNSGTMLNAINPNPDDLLIEDIAHALSMQCRFAGHTDEFYSIAQHSIICSMFAPPGLELEALLHDASEAYIQDITRPLKNKLKGYKAIESKLMKAIAKKFGFNWPLLPGIKDIDNEVLKIEFDCFILSKKKTIKAMTPRMAKKTFLQIFHKLSKCKN